MARINEIEERLSAIKAEIDGADAEKLTALETEVDSLKAERKAITDTAEKRKALLDGITTGTVETKVISTPIAEEKREKAMTDVEKRAKEFVEKNIMRADAAETRTSLLSTGNIAQPTKVSGITEGFNEVSSIIDMVTVEDCTGMSEDKVAYMDTSATAAARTEGSAAADGTPTFNYVTISPSSFNTIAYVSNQIAKTTPLNYTAKVSKSAYDALRIKAAKHIVDKVYASTIADEITTITSIDQKTLRTIAMNYGGDENVVGNATLVLNKADLIAFGDVRGTNEKKAIYEITPNASNPNVGIIKEGGLVVPYIINSNCTALTGATNTSTTATKPTMFYGQLTNFKLDLFGGYLITTSKDYKFAEGLLSILGEADFGGDVVVKDGFVKVSLAKKTS